MASSRRLPVSYNTKTYGTAGAGRDYTSLQTWEDATDNDLVTAQKGEVLECYSDSASYNDVVSIAGATTNSSYFRVIKSASGHKGTLTSGVIFDTDVTGTGVILVGENYFGIYDITIKVDSSFYGGCIYGGGVQVLNVVGIVGVLQSGAGQYNHFGIELDNVGISNQDITIANCYLYGPATTGNFQGIYTWNSGGGGHWNVYNNTIKNFPDAIYALSMTVRVFNTIMQGNGNDMYNAGGATFTTLTNVTSGVTFEADGYHLSGSDTVAKDQGSDLSADTYFAFDDAHDLNTRVAPWDIGCDEFINAGDPNPPTTPFPANAGTGKCEDQILSCYCEDPNSQDMDISFYDASDDSLIGIVSAVASGTRAKMLWEGLTPGTSYTWYAIADNGSGTAQSADWDFTAGEENTQIGLSFDGTVRRYVVGEKIVEESVDNYKITKPLKIGSTELTEAQLIDLLALL